MQSALNNLDSEMKLERYLLIESILEAGGKFESGSYVLRNRNGLPHRDDGPAIIRTDGRQYWYRNGKQHRDDGPAVILSDGTHCWYRNGKLHRENGPAIICPDGAQEWYRYDMRIYPTLPIRPRPKAGIPRS